MKTNAMHTRGPGAWILVGVFSIVITLSALAQNTFNGGAITIPDAPSIGVPGLASPSTITIPSSLKGKIGTVSDVTVTLNNLNHPYAPDVGLLLVGPNGNAVV